MKRLFTFLAASLFFALVNAQTINLQQLVTGISNPIGVYFAPGDDNTLYILQQGGRIRLANAGTGTVSGTDFLNITSKITSSGNEQGLLGLAFHPDYANNGYFFVNYTKTGGGATVIARYKRSTGNPLVADPASEKIVMQITQPFSNHNGGQLQFGRDGYLYIGMGDGGSANDPQGNGQSGTTRLGKMLRVDIDVDSGYAIPASNPFVNDASKLDEIWSLGLRNPWRFSFDMKTADMWIADVGQNEFEEIDFEPANTAGLNYGWRCYEGNEPFLTNNCAPANTFTYPIFQYSHSGGNCSVTGGFVYRGGSYSSLYGKYIFADYCSGKFWLTYPNGSGGWITDQVTTNPQLTFQITSFGQDSKGEMYVVSRDNNRIYKLVGTACASADIYTADGSLESCTGSITLIAPYSALNSYEWYRNDTLLTETSNVLVTTQSAIYKVVTENTSNSCGGMAVAEVIVDDLGTVELSLPQSAYCADAGPIAITTQPSGGTLTGQGISGNSFNPAGLSGNITLTYTVVSGDANCSATDEFEVTVNALPTVAITSSINPNGYCLNDTLALSGSPANGTFSGPGVNAGSFLAATAGVGTHSITYTFEDANGCENQVSQNITVANCYTSISEQNKIQLQVFPNPSNGNFTVKAEENIAELRIYNQLGQLVYRSNPNAAQFNVEVSQLASGIYTMQLKSATGKENSQKLMLGK